MSAVRVAKPVVVAGGGIGGLACALGLARRNFRVLVLEQAREFGELGAGIQLAPNAWHALDALGVGELVKREAVFIERLLLIDGLSGETVIDIPLDLRWAAATLWAAPNTHIVHYPLRGWKLFNLVATVVREHSGAGHNEEAP